MEWFNAAVAIIVVLVVITYFRNAAKLRRLTLIQNAIFELLYLEIQKDESLRDDAKKIRSGLYASLRSFMERITSDIRV